MVVADTKRSRLAMLLYISIVEKYVKRGYLRGLYVDTRDQLTKLLWDDFNYHQNIEGLLKADQSPWPRYGVFINRADWKWDDELRNKYGEFSLDAFKMWKKEWASSNFGTRIFYEVRDEYFNNDVIFQNWKNELLSEVYEGLLCEKCKRNILVNGICVYCDQDKSIIPEEYEKQPMIKKKQREIIELETGLFFDDKSYRLYENIVNATNKNIKILTNSVTYQAIKNIFSNFLSGIDSIEIITNRIRDVRKIKELLKNKSSNVAIYQCKNLHAKLCICDEEYVLVGSSNLTLNSLGSQNRTGMIEANVLSDNKKVIKQALDLFVSIKDGKPTSGKEVIDYECLLSSASGIPKELKNLIASSNEVTLLIAPFVHKRMFGAFKMMNDNAKMKIIVQWPNTSTKTFIRGLRTLKSLFKKKKIELLPIDDDLHSKIYLFNNTDGGKLAFISSLNLTEQAWDKNIEAGLLTKDEQVILTIERKIDELEKSKKMISENPSPRKTKSPTNGPIFGEGVPVVFPGFVPEGQDMVVEFDELYETFKLKYDESDEPGEKERFLMNDVVKINEQIEHDGFITPELDEKREKILDKLQKNYLEEIECEEPEDEEIERERLEIEGGKSIDGMDYIHCALILHHTGKSITKEDMIKIFESVDISYDPIMIDALISSLKDISVSKVLKT